MANTKRRLGRDLSDMGVQELLSDIHAENTEDRIQYIHVNDIRAHDNQPRKTFNQDSIAELSESILEYGILQPLLVSEIKPGRYQIIAGERRYRAALIAKITTIPVVVKKLEALATDSIAITENVQREDLNAIDEAAAYAHLVNNHNLSHEEVAKKVSKSRSSISNFLRLNKLHPEVKSLVQQGSLSMGHARAILGVTYEMQPVLALSVIKRSLSVRQTEALIQGQEVEKNTKPSNLQTKWIVDALKQHSIEASIKGSAEKGKLVLPYRSAADLQRLLDYLTSASTQTEGTN